jgi:hypothetical protein
MGFSLQCMAKIILCRPAESGTNLSLWLAQESQPSQAAPVRQSGSGRPFNRPVTGPTSLLALWSTAKPVSAAAPPLGVSRTSPERSAQPPAVESRDSSRWLLSPAAAVQAPSAAAAVESSVRSLWLPQAASGSAAAAPANLMANWSWQPPSSPSGVDISVAELALMSPPPPPPSYSAWLAGNNGERSVLPGRGRRSSRETCSESSEIMILDTPDENIDFPDDME